MFRNFRQLGEVVVASQMGTPFPGPERNPTLKIHAFQENACASVSAMMTPMMSRRLLPGFVFLLVALVACTSQSPPSASTSAASTHVESNSKPCQRINDLNPKYTLGSGERVIFAIADDYEQTSVTISSCVRASGGYTEEWQAAGYTGRTGFARPGPVHDNSLLTPTGSFSMTEAFGQSDPGTELLYRKITRDSFWGGTPGENFNQYFQGDGHRRDESLWEFMKTGDYVQAAVINYNRPPDMEAVPGRTYAIFLHAGLSETWGCISTDLPTVTRVLQAATPGDHIIMGVEAEIFGNQ